ncbi:MAG: hypothetical protein EXR39_19455 [Betaproteobacteria bacterium]|nr:hypothetical protein [Betaproteobacteria bacterium]
MSQVIADNENLGGSPGLHIALHSISLDIPQRVEIPLRYVIKGLPSLESKHMIYLHVLKMGDGANLVYHGITKRGWMKRYNEHTVRAIREESPLLFHRALRDGCLARLRQLGIEQAQTIQGVSSAHGQMIGNHHVVCAAGLTEDEAMEHEEYLVEKYSFGRADGLNMIPGGRAGLRYLHHLKALKKEERPILDDERDTILERLARSSPRKGMPNPLLAEHWLNPEYAARVICGSGDRFTLDQVAQIRRLASTGTPIAEIRRELQFESARRIRNILSGKTYSRVRTEA